VLSTNSRTKRVPAVLAGSFCAVRASSSFTAVGHGTRVAWRENQATTPPHSHAGSCGKPEWGPDLGWVFFLSQIVFSCVMMFPFDNFEARASLDINGSVGRAGRLRRDKTDFLASIGE
jgi:hypothetical protein